MKNPCEQCGEKPATHDGLCFACYMNLHVEAEWGFRRLWIYLGRQAEFARWCDEHGAAA